MRVPGLGMQIYGEKDLPEGFESLPAFHSKTFIHWLYIKSAVGKTAFSPELSSKAFIIAYTQIWKITHRFLTRSKTPDLMVPH